MYRGTYFIRFFFSISTLSSFKEIQNKHDLYKCKDYMKKIYNSLRKHALKLINFFKKIMRLYINEQLESYENTNI